jgi:hypothetical protein
MRWLLSGAIVLAGTVALGGQSTIPPVVLPPMTIPAGATKPPQRPPVTTTAKAMPHGEIAGRVVDNNSRAVDEATVFLVGQTSLQKAQTDNRGRFTFTNIISGEYVVVARKRGFYDGGFGKRRAGGTPLPVTVLPGQAMSDMQIELFRYGVIAGSIRDEANEPVIGARVVAVRRFFAAGDWKYVEAGSAVTDDQGAYRVYGLEPGEYLVITPTTQIAANVPEERMTAGLLPNTESLALAYPTLFYSSSRYSQLALPVMLAAGEVRYAVNFQWTPVPARSVSGRLTGDAKTVGSQLVRLVPLEGREIGLGNEVAITSSGPDGTFSFERVPAGEYRLEAGGAFGPPRLVEINAIDPDAPPDIYWGRREIAVVDEDVRDVDVRMQTGRAVSGFIESSGGGPIGRVSVAIVPAQPGLSRATAPPVANGRFTTVPLIPGEYYVRVTGLPAGRYLKAITVDGDDALDQPAGLGDTNDPEIIISLTDQPTTIAGSVRDARSLFVSGATVVVMPASTGQWSPNRSRQTRASMSGRFEISGLPAGEYLIVAFDDASADGLQDERVLAQLRTLATRVSLRNQESTTLNLKLSTVKR